MFRTQSMGRENCSKEAGGYKQVCNKRSRQSEHQRSGIKLRKFSILCMGRRKLLGSLNSSLLCAPQLSGANPVSLFTLLPAFPQLLSSHHTGGSICWIAVLGALIHIWMPEIADGCDISCLLIWQEIFSFHIALCQL